MRARKAFTASRCCQRSHLKHQFSLSLLAIAAGIVFDLNNIRVHFDLHSVPLATAVQKAALPATAVELAAVKEVWHAFHTASMYPDTGEAKDLIAELCRLFYDQVHFSRATLWWRVFCWLPSTVMHESQAMHSKSAVCMTVSTAHAILAPAS